PVRRRASCAPLVHRLRRTPRRTPRSPPTRGSRCIPASSRAPDPWISCLAPSRGRVGWGGRGRIEGVRGYGEIELMEAGQEGSDATGEGSPATTGAAFAGSIALPVD